MFNSLKYAKKLEETGVPREQAEAHVLMITEIMETRLATREDMKSLELRLTHAVVLSEKRMTIKLGTIVSVAIAVAVTLAKLVH